MIQLLTIDKLCTYLSVQVNNIFPDKNVADFSKDKSIVKEAITRPEFCFKHASLKHYFNDKEVIFDHLFSDKYHMFLWYLSNFIFKYKGNVP